MRIEWGGHEQSLPGGLHRQRVEQTDILMEADDSRNETRGLEVSLSPKSRSLEPVIVHPSKKLPRYRIARCRANDRIYRALRAKRRIAIVCPFKNVRRWKDRQTIEASTDRAFLQLTPVMTAAPVGQNAILVHYCLHFLRGAHSPLFGLAKVSQVL
jgi:hypothetical protein